MALQAKADRKPQLFITDPLTLMLSGACGLVSKSERMASGRCLAHDD